jgi:hypothetical protein
LSLPLAPYAATIELAAGTLLDILEDTALAIVDTGGRVGLWNHAITEMTGRA